MRARIAVLYPLALLSAGLTLGSAAAQPTPPDPAPGAQANAPAPAPTLPPPTAPCPDAYPIDLLTALQLANVNNPTIAVAQQRVKEAYLALRVAKVAWLPDLRSGATYLRHDGQIQNSRGDVFTTSKQSLFVHADATLAWDVSNLFFAPLIAKRLVDAQAAASQAMTDNVQLDVALTYLSLLGTYAELAVNADTLARAEEMLRNAEAADRAGLSKTPADVNRARTEVNLRREERIDLRGQAAVFSARLARLLLLQPTVDLHPADPTVLPIALVAPWCSLDELVAIGLQNRPEVAQYQALAGAAQARWRQAKVAPFIPHLELSYVGGEFGGGRNSDFDHFNARSDGMAQAYWQLNNLGAGDVARARLLHAQFDEASIDIVDIKSRVAEEVTAAAKLVVTRQESLDSAQQAVLQAEEMWRRLRAAAFGLGGEQRRYDPLEPLLAEQALDQARTRYLHEVIEFNRSEFRLYWALGQPPLCALPGAALLPVEVPVVPPPYAPSDRLPMPRKADEPKPKG